MAGAPERAAMPMVGAPMVEWAVWYAVVLRWRVFPVRRDTKQPYTKHGFKDASTDEAVIRAWWAKHPTANIGLAIPAGWLVVDVDARNDGVVTLNELEHTYSLLPRTLTSLTGSGGGSAHYCFTVAPDADLRGTLGQGLDTRLGEKHYIIVPPSIHANGQRYTWEDDYGPDDVEPQPAPAWLMALLAQPSRNGTGGEPGAEDDGGPIYEGDREAALLRKGGKMLYDNQSAVEIHETLSEMNTARCIPCLGESDIKRLVHNLYKYDAEHKAAQPQLIVNTQAVPLARTDPWMGGTPANDPDWKRELFKKPIKTSDEYYPSEFNITHILRHDPQWRHEEGRTHNMMWYDVIRGRCMIDEEQVSDGLLINLAHWFGGAWRMQFNSTALLEKCVQAHCEANRRDLIQIWLNDLPPWDETPRLDTWLIDIAKAVDDDKGYTRHVSRRLPLSMVARAMVPGCQYREVVILEGPQNIGKSHILQTLASREWYVEMSMNLETKESHMMLQSAWLAELSELDSMNRTEKARLKAFITMETDTYVPKYRNGTVSYPRRSVMVGTTNDIEYLTDITGNSRFLPVWTPGPITLEPLQEIREQLFAEALQAYREAGDTWWYIPEQVADEAAFQQQERRVTSEWYAPLEAWLTIDRVTQPCYEPGFNAKGDPISVPVVFTPGRTSWPEIARWFLGIEKREGWRDNRLTTPILNCLREMKWTRGKRSRIPGEGRSSYWYSPTYEGEQEDAQWEF